jgi:hypothetical protein
MIRGVISSTVLSCCVALYVMFGITLFQQLKVVVSVISNAPFWQRAQLVSATL